jgi:hypothetical protein
MPILSCYIHIININKYIIHKYINIHKYIYIYIYIYTYIYNTGKRMSFNDNKGKRKSFEDQPHMSMDQRIKNALSYNSQSNMDIFTSQKNINRYECVCIIVSVYMWMCVYVYMYRIFFYFIIVKVIWIYLLVKKI